MTYELGQKVRFSGEVRKVKQGGRTLYVEEDNDDLVVGYIMGKRTVIDYYWGYGAESPTADIGSHKNVYLVAYSLSRKPAMVLKSQLEAVL